MKQIETSPELASEYGWPGHEDPHHQDLYLKPMLLHLNLREHRRVLDLGCGEGNFAASLQDAGFQMFGIDQNEETIAKAITRYPGVRFVRGTAYGDLTEHFDATTFDAIISVEVIEHMYDPDEFVARAYEALRPGGLFIVTTPYWGYLKNVLLSLTNRMDRALTALWPGGHIKHWSYATLRTLLERHGFQFVAFHGCGRRIPYCWNGMMMVVIKPPVTNYQNQRLA